VPSRSSFLRGSPTATRMSASPKRYATPCPGGSAACAAAAGSTIGRRFSWC